MTLPHGWDLRAVTQNPEHCLAWCGVPQTEPTFPPRQPGSQPAGERLGSCASCPCLAHVPAGLSFPLCGLGCTGAGPAGSLRPDEAGFSRPLLLGPSLWAWKPGKVRFCARRWAGRPVRSALFPGDKGCATGRSEREAAGSLRQAPGRIPGPAQGKLSSPPALLCRGPWAGRGLGTALCPAWRPAPLSSLEGWAVAGPGLSRLVALRFCLQGDPSPGRVCR